jgi:signal transduction histidine kinase
MFQQLPFVVGTNPNIGKVYDLYWHAFEAFRNYKELTTTDENSKFCEFLNDMLDEHNKVIPLLVLGIHESQKYMGMGDLDKFMNETLQSRLSRRVLAEQHLALTKTFQNLKVKSSKTGIVDSRCRAIDSINNAVKTCDTLFMDTFATLPPKVVVDGHMNSQFTYIPGHVEYIIFELMKNSMKHTFEKHGEKMPDIRVTVGSTDDHVMFRVSDCGIEVLIRRWSKV